MYDLLHLSPTSLKKQSAIAVSIEIWRCEINKYRTRNTLRDFRPSSKPLRLKTMFTDVPPVLNDLIKECVEKFGDSLEVWLQITHEQVFKLHRVHKNDILKDFDDFVGYFDGSICYGGTAKRMLRCDQLDQVLKFKIACAHCLEEDIVRIWPSVCENIDMKGIDQYPTLHYWTCRLRNELDKIPNPNNESIEEVIFKLCLITRGSRISMLYFWHRMPWETQMQRLVHLLFPGINLFTRLLVPRLDTQQLDVFVDAYGCDLMYALLSDIESDVRLILPAWMRIRNTIKQNDFNNLVVKMLENEHKYCEKSYYAGCKGNRENVCCEIWINAPLRLKQSTIRYISNSSTLFESWQSFYDVSDPVYPRDIELLLNILSCATFEQRRNFWHNCWHNLIAGLHVEDLQEVMEMCFETQTDDDIAQFKFNVMANSEYVRAVLSSLLRCSFVEELNDLVEFFYPDIEIARSIKQQLLQSVLLGEPGSLKTLLVEKAEELNILIDDAFNSVHLAAHFKDQLIQSPAILTCILMSIQSDGGYAFKRVISFMNRFVSTEQDLMLTKKRLLECLETLEADGSVRAAFSKRSCHPFLLWCLGSYEDVDDLMLMRLVDNRMSYWIHLSLSLYFLPDYIGPYSCYVNALKRLLLAIHFDITTITGLIVWYIFFNYFSECIPYFNEIIGSYVNSFLK